MEAHRKSEESLRQSICNLIGNQKILEGSLWSPIGNQKNPQGHPYGILSEIKGILEKNLYGIL